MKAILEKQLEKILINISEAKELNQYDGIIYFQGQRDLVYNLLSLCIE